MARGAGGPQRQLARVSRQPSAAAADPLAATGRVAPAAAAGAAAGSLVIRRTAVDVMLADARRALPNECCGLLIGNAVVIDRAAPARNLRASPDRYLIDPADHCAALRVARAAGFEVVGAYHSHPDGTLRPSAVDCREATYPEFIYAIVSPEGARRGRVAAFRLRRDGFDEVRLRVEA